MPNPVKRYGLQLEQVLADKIEAHIRKVGAPSWAAWVREAMIDKMDREKLAARHAVKPLDLKPYREEAK